MKYALVTALAVILIAVLVGCMQKLDGPDMVGHSYTQITQDQAKEMMLRDDGHIIVDVRREDEFAEGHIPGAICIPNESIGTEPPAELSDFDQIILIYCRSGNRSKQAAQKLFALGYNNIYEFGGIIDWTGEIETSAQSAVLSFDSFDGGGPAYTVRVDDPNLIAWQESVYYAKEDHEQMTGAGYTVTYTFTGRKPGTTLLTVECRSPIAENYDASYSVTVDESLNVSIEHISTRDLNDREYGTPMLVLEVNGHTFHAAFADNPTAQALLEELRECAAEIVFGDYGGFEKVGYLPWEFPENNVDMTTEPGDIVLYQGERLCVYYGENTWSLTPIAKIDGVTREELLEAFGEGEVLALIDLEWVE